MTLNGRSTLCYSVVVDPGEASSTGFQDFLEMFGARHSSGDLFDLVRQGGGAGGGGSSMELQPTSLRLSSSPPITLPPSEDDMAAWLYPIVSGQEEPAVVAGHDGHHASDDAAGRVALDDAPADHKWARPPNMQEKCRSGAEDSTENCYSCGSRKKATGGERRSHSHPAETHNLTEKRRRRKINDKLKTLRQLVPGCDDKSNQASTLDQTIQHIKSLQQQIQAMSFGGGGMMKPPPAVVPPPGTGGVAAGMLQPVALAPAVLAMARGHVVRRPGVVLAPAPPPAMAPFGPLLPLVHITHHPAAAVRHGAPVSNHADEPAGSGCSKCLYSKNSRSQRQSL